MTTDKATLGIEELHNAARRLKEFLDVPRDHTGRVDAIIRRFEFCYELSWKSLRAVLELCGHETPSPRQAFKKAFVMNLIGDENIWLKMLEDRNVISHTYKNLFMISTPALAFCGISALPLLTYPKVRCSAVLEKPQKSLAAARS